MEYRIEAVQIPGHGLKNEPVLSDPLGYELFKRDGIRLVSMGIYATEDAAKQAAVARSGEEPVKFV